MKAKALDGGDKYLSVRSPIHQANLHYYHLDFYLQQLTIAREIGDPIGEVTVLGNLGITYQELRDYKLAID